MNKKLKRQITAFYIVIALYSCFFATGNWYFLWKLYLTNHGIGLVDGLCYAAGILAEIPSGAIADMFGRKKAIVLSAILMGIGYTITGFAFSGAVILVGYLIYSVGASFYSGSDDALMYDHLKKHNQEHQWKHIVTNKNIYSRIAALSATFLGGLLFALNFRLPSITRGVFFLLMLIPLIVLPENYGTENPDKSFKKYMLHIAQGMKQLLLPSILKLLPLFIIVGSFVGTTYVGGILRPLLLAKAGFNGVTQGYVITFAGIITTIILLLYKRNLNKTSGSSSIWMMSIVTLLCFSMLSIVPSYFWLPLLVLIQILQGLFIPATSDYINHKIPSSHRATTLSTLSLTQSLPYVFAAPLIGSLADHSNYSMITWGIATAIFIAIAISLILYSRRTTPKFV